MCSARRRGGSAATPPAEMQRRSRHRQGRSNQSGPADMPTVLTQNMQRFSNLQFSSSSLQPCFRFSSNFLVHARRVALESCGNPVCCRVNIHVNIYNEYSDKYSSNFLHEYLWWNGDIYFTKRIFKMIFLFWEIFFWIFNCNLNIMNIC